MGGEGSGGAALSFQPSALSFQPSALSFQCSSVVSSQSGQSQFLGRFLVFSEDLHHGFALSLVDLGQGVLHQWAVFKAAVAQHFAEAERAVAEQDLDILEALVVVGDRDVDAVGSLLHLAEQVGGLFPVAGGVFLQAELGHLVNQLRVEKALVAGLGLAGLDRKRIDGLLIEGLVVEPRGERRKRCHSDKHEDCERHPGWHEEPPAIAVKPHAVTI